MPVTNIDELFEQYKPIPNPNGCFMSIGDDGAFYDWSLSDLQSQNIPANRVVSISITDPEDDADPEDEDAESADSIYCFASGIHSMISEGYIITSEPITEDICFED